MNNEALTVLLKNPNIARLVDLYRPSKETEQENKAASLYPKFAERLGAQRFVLPLTGVQGSGKSTLLNAIAFDHPVLPIEADETTCVPVEIVWSPDPSKEARILFFDKTEKSIPATAKALALYVDNDTNPGNEVYKVDRVILESNCPALESGIVLVDLPGIGSITTQNIETTKKYLEESVGIMYLLRTMPPLTRSEALFLSFQWVRFQTAIFIQNWWGGEIPESVKQVEEGREQNMTNLKKIARDCRIKLGDDFKIYVVKAYEAYKGALGQNAEMTNSSGLAVLMEALDRLATEWPETLRKTYKAVLQKDLSDTRGEIRSRIQKLSADAEKLNEDMKSEQIRFEKYIEEIKEKIGKVKEKADEFKKEHSGFLNTWKKRTGEELRNNMRTKMRDHAIVDGPRLERAIKDEESVVFDDVFAHIQEAILRFHDEINDQLNSIPEWKRQKDGKFHTVTKPEARKYENIAPKVGGGSGGILGGIGGGAAAAAAIKAGGGAAAAAAKIGAALGVGGGPVGIAVGGIVGGIVGGLVGLFIGQKARKVVIKKRAESVRSQVFTAIDRFTEDNSADLFKKIEEFIDQIVASISKFESEQISRFEEDKARKLETLNQSAEDKDKQKKSLESDLDRVNVFLSALEKEEL